MRLIASDYDGTFYIGEITDEQRQAIRDWQAAGNLLGIVSGRSIDCLPPFLAEDGVECDYFIANNGAVIADGKGNILQDTRCDGSITVPLTKALFRLGCPYASVITEFPCNIYAEKPNPKPGRYTLEDAPEVKFFHQVSTVLPNFEEAARVTAAIAEEFGDVVNPLQNGRCIDIVPKGIDKAAGIRAYIALKGLTEEDVIAVGDNVNDAAMIEAFYSYAVENAVDSIKAMANKITPNITSLIRAEMSK